MDLERRIGEIERDLAKYDVTRTQLTMLQQQDDVTTKEANVKEELEFVEAQIAGLKQELTPLKGKTINDNS